MHANVGLGNGLGQVGVGGSHSDENKVAKGGDLTIRAGGGAVLAVTVILLLPVIAVAF